jgi:hypothetical protein
VNELVTIRQGANVEAYRASTEAADLCKEIVVATSSNIQGRRYVAVEGWQAIAIAHGCALSARDVEKVEGGVRAIGEVRRMSDGQLIATAEGFVGEDEPTWYGGQSRGKTLPKRADYAIRAMAQTRAMSRAGRTAFAHVVVMMNAGLATTPAEEMVTFDAGTGEIIESGHIAVSSHPRSRRWSFKCWRHVSRNARQAMTCAASSTSMGTRLLFWTVRNRASSSASMTSAPKR